MNIVPYEAQHLLFMQLQDGQAYCEAFVDEGYAKALEGEYAFTGMVDGVPIALGGITPIWSNRGLLWAYVDRRAGAHFVAVHRAVQRFLDMQTFRRIEAYTPWDFAAGHRWLQKLGFELEAPRMRAFRVDGGDSAMYAKVKT